MKLNTVTFVSNSGLVSLPNPLMFCFPKPVGSSTPTFSDPQSRAFRKSARSKLERVSIAPSDVGSSGEGKACVRMPAFLQLVSCNCAPHTLYFAPILPGITLVVLSEVSWI